MSGVLMPPSPCETSAQEWKQNKLMGPSESVTSCYSYPLFPSVTCSDVCSVNVQGYLPYLLGKLKYSSVCFSSKGYFKIVTIFELREMVLLKNNNKCFLDTLQLKKKRMET